VPNLFAVAAQLVTITRNTPLCSAPMTSVQLAYTDVVGGTVDVVVGAAIVVVVLVVVVVATVGGGAEMIGGSGDSDVGA